MGGMDTTIIRPVVRTRTDLWLLAAVAVTSLADGLTTWIVLAGGGVERNGWARAAMDTIGLGPVIVLRVAIPVVLCAAALRAARWLGRGPGTLPLLGVWFAILGSAVVATHNAFAAF